MNRRDIDDNWYIKHQEADEKKNENLDHHCLLYPMVQVLFFKNDPKYSRLLFIYSWSLLSPVSNGIFSKYLMSL